MVMTGFEKEDFVKYRMAKAHETLRAAQVLVDHKLWNSVVNRLYYACFYAVSALLAQSDLSAKTHSGMKTSFFQHFVKTGKVSLNLAKLYADLFDGRQKGDYNDFYDFKEESVINLFKGSTEFIEKVGNLIDLK